MLGRRRPCAGMVLPHSRAMGREMRTALAALGLLAAAAGLAAPAPPIDALKDFQPGQWQMKLVGEEAGASRCVTDSNLLLMGGRAANACSFSLIDNQPQSAVVTYRCTGGRSGRTELRRDAGGLYVVNAQGLEAGLPFANRTEWRRLGKC